MGGAGRNGPSPAAMTWWLWLLAGVLAGIILFFLGWIVAFIGVLKS